MVCDNCFCNGLGTLMNCIPVVAILAMVISVFGFSFTTAGMADLIDGLQNFGIKTDAFEHYLLGAALSIVIIDGVILVFAFFSTGCCKERCFHHAKTSCGACFNWMMGPIAQVVFFVLALGSTLIAFMATNLCLVTAVVGILTESSCETEFTYDYAGNEITIEGSTFLGEIVQNAELPSMLDSENKTIDGTVLCVENDDFKAGGGSGFIGFTLIMFGQILFLIKIAYTYLALREEMGKEEKDEDAPADGGEGGKSNYGTQLVGAD